MTTPNHDCYLCCIYLEEGTEKHGQPLTQNCAYIVDSGWAHVACLAVQTDRMPTDDFTESTKDYCIGKAWYVWHTCKTEHQGNLRRTLADKWVEDVAGFDETSC